MHASFLCGIFKTMLLLVRVLWYCTTVYKCVQLISITSKNRASPNPYRVSGFNCEQMLLEIKGSDLKRLNEYNSNAKTATET